MYIDQSVKDLIRSYPESYSSKEIVFLVYVERDIVLTANQIEAIRI